MNSRIDSIFMATRLKKRTSVHAHEAAEGRQPVGLPLIPAMNLG
jgi:hypothetical protein